MKRLQSIFQQFVYLRGRTLSIFERAMKHFRQILMDHKVFLGLLMGRKNVLMYFPNFFSNFFLKRYEGLSTKCSN